jgi:hypothetical protein
MKFDDETTDVLIGGYLSKNAAQDDYEAALGSGGYLHGAVVVSKDLKGNLSVEQTDHMVREGAASAPSASPSACSRRHCSPRPRSARPWAPEPANCCTTGPPTSWKRKPGPPSRSAAPASSSPTPTRQPERSSRQ